MKNVRATSEGEPFVLDTELHLDVRGPGLGAGLTDALREAVRTGRLSPGSRLPSTRSLATHLGVARNTVAAVYAELVAEGWLVARQGSGTRVVTRSEPRRAVSAAPQPRPTQRAPLYGLQPGPPDLSAFPRKQWLAAARRALSAAPHDALGYGDAQGRSELRTALADRLSRARGVYADPECVVVCSGFHHGLALMAHVLRMRRVRAVAVESYGLRIHRDVLTGEGLHLPALYVDEHGARIDDLPALRAAGAVLLTPAHQYPTGVALRPDRRAAAVDWARHTGGLILEDDDDGEFRYDRQPVGALQGLDPERVVYFGSVSKSLAPGLRLGWMVVPGDLVADVVAAKANGDCTPSALGQLTLAEFITSGAYDRHIRAMRVRYRRRREQLAAAVADRSPEVRLSGMAAGLQVVLELPWGTELSVVRAAASQGLAVSALTEFRYEAEGAGRSRPEQDALVVHYAAPSDSAWEGALEALGKALP